MKRLLVGALGGCLMTSGSYGAALLSAASKTSAHRKTTEAIRIQVKPLVLTDLERTLPTELQQNVQFIRFLRNAPDNKLRHILQAHSFNPGYQPHAQVIRQVIDQLLHQRAEQSIVASPTASPASSSSLANSSGNTSPEQSRLRTGSSPERRVSGEFFSIERDAPCELVRPHSLPLASRMRDYVVTDPKTLAGH